MLALPGMNNTESTERERYPKQLVIAAASFNAEFPWDFGSGRGNV